MRRWRALSPGEREWLPILGVPLHAKGQSRDLGLGPAVGADAGLAGGRRGQGNALRLQVKSGVDPLTERHRMAAEEQAAGQAAQIAGITFRSVAEAYIAANEDSWRNAKHRQQWSNTLSTYVYPVIGEVLRGECRHLHVLQILEPIWKAKPETASRLRGRIETILDAARRGATAKVRTRLGAATLPKSCPPAQGCRAAIIRLCPTQRCPFSCRSYGSGKRRRHWRWSSRYSPRRGPARCLVPLGMRSTSTNASGPSLPAE